MADPTTAPTLPPATAALLGEFARSCKAATRAVSLYPAQHPAIGSSLSRLVEATGRLTADGPLRLEVRADVLLIGQARPAKPDAAVRELAELLHRHLIGALTVNAGADADSWRTLLLLLGRTPDEVRADGGIAHLWATAGGPSLEIREIDYAEVLRDKRGTVTSLDEIIAAALDGAQLQIDDESIDALLAILEDPGQLDALMQKLESAARERGGDARAAAVIEMLRAIVAHAREQEPRQLEATLRKLGRIAARLSADDMLRLLSLRHTEAPGRDEVAAVLNRMPDDDIARFVAGSIAAEGGASARLAHAFQALVPDIDRQRRLLALVEEQVPPSALGPEASFDELWGKVETMVTSYSDAGYVSDAYARELWNAQSQATALEHTSDDPPERISGWLATVGDAALRHLDHQLLTDLLRIEQDPARWRDVAETAAAHVEDLVRVNHFDPALSLADTLIREGEESSTRGEHLPGVLQRFGRGTMMKQVATHLRGADDETFARFERLCRALGPPVIAPLAEALSAEQDARLRRRLRDVLVGFGAQGREVVQQLMQASNWEVRRTAAFLLREFGGSEGLRELIPLLTDSEPLVQREAVQGLVLNGSDEAARILIDALDKVSGRARQTLVSELVAVRDPRASSVYCHLARHLNRAKHADAYLGTVEALGGFSDPDAVDALAEALQAGRWWAPVRTRRTRAAAASALARIRTPHAVDALKHAAAAGGRGTRAAARAALAELQ